MFALLATACMESSSNDAGGPFTSIPRPTEHRLDDGAESVNKSLRRAWMRGMHLSAPGDDWQGIEQRNGEREMARRTAMNQTSQTALSVSRWSEVGSRNQAGRMHCATLSPDSDTLYAGSSLGGIWKGDTDGQNWTPLGDNLYGGGRHLVVLPGEQSGDPDVIIAATGQNRVWITRDQGSTWEAPAGLPNFGSVRGLQLLEDSAGTVLVLGRFNGNVSIHASTDHGHSFQTRWTGAVDWASSMWSPRYGPGSEDTIYLLHRGRLRVSTDAGLNFSLVGTIDPAATSGFLTGSEAGGPTLYASLNISGTWKLFRSDDAGSNWNHVYDPPDYWGALEASASNPSLVCYGGVDAYRSTDGGQSFDKINSWGEYYSNPAGKLHADQQGINCFPDPQQPGIGDLWYFNTDGGIYLSTDETQSVQNLCLTGLGVSQYYSTHTSSFDNTHIIAGSQDQGLQLGDFQASTGPGPSTDFDQVISGDYGHLTSSNGSHDFVYCTYPGFILIDIGEGGANLKTADFPAGANHLWLPPVVADPLDSLGFFFLGDRLHRYIRTGPGVWSDSQHSNEAFDDGGASYLSAMAFAPTNPNRAYAVNDRGRLYSSTDHGVTWSLASGDGPNSHYFYGNAVAVNPHDELEAFIGGSGYSNGAVRRTTDGGATWHELSLGLPSTLVYDLAYSLDGTGDVYAATEAGAWHLDVDTETWVNVMQSHTPMTLYWSVEAVPGLPESAAVMRFGTYGRGIWDYDVPDGTNGTWEIYGTGASSANSLTLSSATPPNLGTTIQFDIAGALSPGSTGFVMAGRQRGEHPLHGGVQLVDVVLRNFSFSINPNGTATRNLPLPNIPSWAGVGFRFQALMPDSGQPGGYSLSNGLEAFFGLDGP